MRGVIIMTFVKKIKLIFPLEQTQYKLLNNVKIYGTNLVYYISLIGHYPRIVYCPH